MDELYVLARRVLLDALDALGPHRDAAILVGAQAIYLHTGAAELAVAEYTTDADLAFDPVLLGEIPPLEQSLRSAGFRPADARSVGVWKSIAGPGGVEVVVDLLVPSSVSPGKGRRAARLVGHLDELFGSRGASGSAMAARAVHPLMDEHEIRLSCEVLAGDLIVAMR